MTPPLATRLVVDLRPLFEGWPDPVLANVGLDGAIYATAKRSSESFRDGGFAKSRIRPTDYLVVRCVDDHVDTVVVRDESIAVSYVQPHPDGVLLAGARCGLHASGAEQNAVVYDWNGSAQARFTLGDGIQDLRVTPSGQIWAAYFDEGVLGNHGWGEHGATPIGAAGLVAFSSAGDVAFKYDPRAARTDMIVDAYALNVAGDDDVWLYFYTEFPIVRIQRGQYRVWRTEVRGARALAVRDHHALLFGDYQHRSGAHVLELQRGGVTALRRTVPVVDDSGEPLDRAGVWGVAGNLYFLKDRRVLVAEDW